MSTFFIEGKILILDSLFIVDFSFSETITEYFNNKTSQNKLKPILYSFQMFEHSPQYLGPKIYNKLLIEIQNINKFKHVFENWLLLGLFYSVSQFLES